jgi:anti-sigma B factor antagonist
MKMTQTKLNDVLVCVMEGEININTAVQLRKDFEEIIKNNDKKVLMDFSAVSYVDSSGLATLIEMLQRLKKTGGKLRLCNMDQKVKNIFEVTKLYKFFEIFETQEGAIKDF